MTPYITTPSSVTSTYTTAIVYTVTSCLPAAPHCERGMLTTEIVTSTTTWCPETTATYTMHMTWTCSEGMRDCSDGATKTSVAVVTVAPVKTKDHPTVLPGYSSHTHGGDSPMSTPHSYWDSPTRASTVITTATPCSTCRLPGGERNATQTAASVVTAGAATLGLIPGVVTVVLGVLVAALM